MKTKMHDISRDFQRFLDSAVIALHVLNDSVFDLGLIALRCFMRHAVLLPSSWHHCRVNQITNVEKSTSSAGILEVQ